MIAELDRVTKRYGSVIALDDVSLTLAPRRVTALLGPNAAGKTTAVRLLLGLTRPSAGRVALFGIDPRLPLARRRTGVLLQIASVPETLRVREHVRLFRSYYPAPMSEDAVFEAAGIREIADRRFGELSGGQKQRVQFALAICGNPELLFLDEPTVGLDVQSRRAFWQQVRQLADAGCSILLTTHYLEEADALAHRIVVINGGRIVADGAPHEIKALAASRQVRCVTSVPSREILAMPGVTSVRQDGTALEILAADAEGLARALLVRDPLLTGLEVRGAGLEDAFLALTSVPSARASLAPAHDLAAASGGLQ
jgi:ABC-2 type transport system ATP-binding protein